ncbi:hypothetical protein Hamer_G003924 [Homarus americanus]|uniref:Uncharacterized protein n=1 Tax=Homarus americanus TaxID=6706 RepID=A0A8J5NEL8_HOMAM|nr:hypothetical protein Hamer_G003924 [Homarus americanus]
MHYVKAGKYLDSVTQAEKNGIRKVEANFITEALKESKVSPIHKGGSKGLAKNYRPVTLTSHPVKILYCNGKSNKRKIGRDLKISTAFNDGQHGFKKGHSCFSQLLLHHEALLEDMRNEKDVDVVYLDFAKVFY